MTRSTKPVVVAAVAMVALTVMASTSVEAQPVTLGGEFFANTYYTAAQRTAAVAMASDGSYIITWESVGQDLDDGGILAQRFDSTGGLAGTEFVVNVYVPLRQAAPDVAVAADGGFVVVWQSDGQDGNDYGVFGQRYASDGAVAGTEFQINTYFSGSQLNPSVVTFADGGFVVVWEGGGGQDGDGYGIIARRFASDGLPASAEFIVNAGTEMNQYRPRVDAKDDDGFVIVWGSNDGRDGDGYGVFGQRFDSVGSADGTEFLINNYTTAAQRFPDVAVSETGQFMVVWQSYGADMSNEGIGGRRYDSGGDALGGEFVVNTYAYDDQRYPRLAADSWGGFVVAWESEGLDGESEGILAQQFDSTGGKTGIEFLVNTFIGNAQRFPAIASGETSPFVVAWQSAFQDQSDYGIFGQRYLDEMPVCGDAANPGLGEPINPTDVSVTLRTSVGLSSCLLCICDVNNDASVKATDALLVLREAVMLPVVLICPPAC